MSCSVAMLEVGWVFEETSDGRKRTFGDLMSIFEKAPRTFIDTELVKTFIESIWGSYYKAILRYRLAPAILYLLTSILYYSYLMFRENFPYGIKSKERFEFNPESVTRWTCCGLLLYHLFYESL